MAVIVKSDVLAEIIDPEATLEKLGDGFGFLEGLVWRPSEQALHFSDLTKDTRWRWVASSKSCEVTKHPSRMSNGMTLDADDNLLICEHVTNSLVRETKDGTREVIASHHEGKELNSPNDVVTAPDGSIYFTDPPYGRVPGWGIERPQDLDFQGVYRVPAGTKDLQLLITDFEGPNGLAFSPDNSLLYINDTAKGHIRVFDVEPDGGITNGRVFAENVGRGIPEEGVVDGMKIDERGDVFVTGPEGIWIFSPDGEHLGNIRVAEGVGNFTWGGPDYRTLFIGANTTLYRLPTRVAAHREPYM